MKYNNATLTASGTSLLQSLALTAGVLTITRIVTGDGSYVDGEDLVSKTELKNPLQDFPCHQIERDTNDQIRIMTVATNDGLDTGYYMTEMGIFARGESGDEILLAIAVAYNPAEADYMPPDDQSFSVGINILSYIRVSSTVEVTVISDTAYAALSDFLIVKRRVDLISVSDDGQGNVVLTLPI